MPLITLKNTALNIDPNWAATYQGWEVSETIARHSSCVAGYMTAPFVVEPGNTYKIRYLISEYTSGLVRPVVNGQNGTSRTALGYWEDTFVVPDNATDLTVKFYSDGTLGVKLIQFYPYLPDLNNSICIGFNTKENRYPSYYSIECGFMVKFVNDLFAFGLDGRLWRQNVNDVRNNFFGEQFTSKIRFVCNVDHQKNKLFYNLRLDQKGVWYCPEMTTPATDQFPVGMTSVLTKNLFKLIDGKLWADIQGDMNDPNFANISPLSLRQAQALFRGRTMQGCYLIVDLECANTDELKLASVEVYYTEVERTF